MKRINRVFFFEIDTGGSWKPRFERRGPWHRWIAGPFSFGYIVQGFSGLMTMILTRYVAKQKQQQTQPQQDER